MHTRLFNARKSAPSLRAWLLMGMATALLSSAMGQSTKPTDPAPASSGQSAPASSPGPSRYHQSVPRRALQYYSMVWGVDSLDVKWTESGEVIRFTYRVLDPMKAAVLNDNKFEPSLIDPDAGVKLVVPSLEKVGKLRQSSTPEAGKSYWMAFSNKGRYVKKGHRVDVVIGTFRAEGLVVN